MKRLRWTMVAVQLLALNVSLANTQFIHNEWRDVIAPEILYFRLQHCADVDEVVQVLPDRWHFGIGGYSSNGLFQTIYFENIEIDLDANGKVVSVTRDLESYLGETNLRLITETDINTDINVDDLVASDADGN